LARTPLVTASDQNLPNLYRGQDTPQSLFAKQLKSRLQTAFEMIWEAQKDYQDPQLQPVQYNIGNKILMYNHQLSKQSKSRKFLLDWIGPLEVVKKLLAIRLDAKWVSTGKMVFNIHVSMIKPFFE
jgi:hypothetical protein